MSEAGVSQAMTIKNLIQWSVRSRLVVILLSAVLMVFGIYSFMRVNVEAYPDPAPPIVEVIAQYPGARPRRSSGK